tara:strand:+ start:154 stop:558 length:405 start_codon:yes stop_codon:yes gene_type:complete
LRWFSRCFNSFIHDLFPSLRKSTTAIDQGLDVKDKAALPVQVTQGSIRAVWSQRPVQGQPPQMGQSQFPLHPGETSREGPFRFCLQVWITARDNRRQCSPTGLYWIRHCALPVSTDLPLQERGQEWVPERQPQD